MLIQAPPPGGATGADAEAVQAGNGGHDRQAQAESRPLAGAAAATEEALVDQRAVLWRNARPVVDHIDPRGAVIIDRTQQDAAVCRGELQGIGQQVGQCFEQQLAVSTQRAHLRVHLQLQQLLLLFGQRQVELVQFLQQLGDVDRVEGRTSLVALQLGYPQQRGEARHQHVGLGQRLVQWIGMRVLFVQAHAHAVQMRAQAGQRGAQIVGDAVADSFDFGHQLFDAFQHGIDDARQPIDLVATAGDRQALAEVAGNNSVGGRFDLLDTFQRAPTQQMPAHQAGNDGQRHAPQQCIKDDAVDRHELAILAYEYQRAAIAGHHAERTAAVVVAAIGQRPTVHRMRVAIQRQSLGDRSQRARHRHAGLVEQPIGIDLVQIEALAVAQCFIQCRPVEAHEQMGALLQARFGQVTEVVRDAPVHHAQQQARPRHEQDAVQAQQPAAGGTPVVRIARRRHSRFHGRS